MQYRVTKEAGTEPPFKNEFWHNDKEGLYVDIISGEPLFSSKDKFDSGTGWPSFTQPLKPDALVEKTDRGLMSERTEVRTKLSDAHLGHVFNDGPAPKGLRYCMNSAALKFIPKEKLKEAGYGEYAALFSNAKTETAVFAGGCFWSMQHAFDNLKGKGILSTRAGFAGGSLANPTYEQVSAGDTGHFEAVEVTYDPKKISYEKLLQTYWLNIDPLDANGQFCDKGEEYKSVVFAATEEQKAAFVKTKAEVAKNLKIKGEIQTQMKPAAPFYPAEDYHQDFAKKNPVRYKAYRTGCRRDARSKALWGKAP